MAAPRDSFQARLHNALAVDLWQEDLQDAPVHRRAAVGAVRVAVLVVDGFRRHHLPTRAAALAFTTVFGLVPTLAVAFAMFKAFGGIDDAREVLLPYILDYLAVGVRDQVAARIEEMLATIHGGAIGAVGSLFVLGAVISLLSSIEDTFDQIWGVRRTRSYFQRVPVYFTVVTLTPVLLIGGLSLPAMLRRLTPVAWAIDHSGPLQVMFAGMLPLLLVWAGFSVLYGFMTSARVPWRAALAGGIVGGTVWSIAIWGYAAYAGTSAFYTTVYGPLAAVPVFLFWLYLSWTIVLVGAQIACAAASVVAYRDARLAADVGLAQRALLCLGVAAHVADRFIRTAEPATRASLQQELDASGRLVNEIVDEMIDKDLLQESAEDGVLLPARDPHSVTAADILRALAGPADAGNTTALGAIARRGARAAAAAEKAWEGVTCAELGEELARSRRSR
jgi:membrane protein